MAEGADVNQRARGGQTALMLAAILGHVDIARLLLAAGADVRLKDNLGLTAREWAHRRGFWEVAQLFSNASLAELVPSQENAPAKQARPKVEAKRGSPGAKQKTMPQQDALRRTEEQQRPIAELQRREPEEARDASLVVTKIEPQQDALRGTEEQQRPIADLQRREVEESREASPIETKIAPQQGAPSVVHEQQRTRAEPERREGEEAHPTATQSPTIAARIEQQRILEESRQRVEAEIHAKFQRAARAAMEHGHCDVPSSEAEGSQPSISAEVGYPREFHVDHNERDTRQEGHPAEPSTKLVGADDPLFNSPAAHDWTRPIVWGLVAIMAVEAASIGYLINNYLPQEKRPSTPIAAQIEQPEIAGKNVPRIGGALSGMEVKVPDAEYPATAKTEGIIGTIRVQVQVNNKGRVISARSSGGDWRLRAAAVKAAQKATFSAEKLAGRGANGTITYVFRQ